MLINILIPTYQRAASLKKNLEWLIGQIKKNKLSNLIDIIISDNASTDNTQVLVEQIIRNEPTVTINYLRSNKNLGLEKNMVKIAQAASADFILWTGDDDFIAEGYLQFIVDSLNKNQNIAYIIPGLSSLHADGSITEGRASDFSVKMLNKGYDSAYEYSHFAHQMSGLLMKREGLIEEYLALEHYRNPYLFIYLTTNRMLRYEGIYAPAYQTLVSIFNEKDWSYNDIGLLDEVVKNYIALSEHLTAKEIDNLVIRFIIMHSYRLAFRPFRPKIIFKQYLKILMLRKSLCFRKKLTFTFVKESLAVLLK